jgi:hypothetical protein
VTQLIDFTIWTGPAVITQRYRKEPVPDFISKFNNDCRKWLTHAWISQPIVKAESGITRQDWKRISVVLSIVLAVASLITGAVSQLTDVSAGNYRGMYFVF